MNDKQKYLLIAITILLTIAILFPPFQLVGREGIKVSKGFHFIFLTGGIELVNSGLLFMEWLFIVFLGFIGWLFFNDGSLIKKA